MDKDAVHSPELPGVRTFKKDVAEDHGSVKFDTTKLTVPVPSVQPGHEHELPPPPGDKHVFDVERAYNNSSVQVGTIVTDKKKSTHSIGYLASTAFSEWWSNTRKSFEEKTGKTNIFGSKHIPTVISPEARTNIIQEAAKYAKQAPRDDHAVIVQKMRTLAHDAEAVTGKPFSIQSSIPPHAPSRKSAEQNGKVRTAPVLPLPPKSAQPVLTRSHSSLAAYAEKTHALPNKPTEQSVPAFTVAPMAKSMSSRSGQPLVPHTSKSRVDLRSALKETLEKERTDREESERRSRVVPPAPVMPPETMLNVAMPEVSTQYARPDVSPEPLEVPLSSNYIETQDPEVTPPPREKLVIPSVPRPVPQQVPAVSQEVRTPAPQASEVAPPVSHPSRWSPHILKTALYSSIAVVAAGLGIFAALIVTQNVMDEPTTVVEQPRIETFLAADTTAPIPLRTTRAELFTSLQAELARNTTQVVHLYPVTLDGEREIPASTESILEVLAPRAQGSFLRSLNETMMLGGVGDTTHDPFIILESSNFDVAFAGMLKWERDMSSDLAPLFGDVVLKTLEPTGTMKDTNPHFVDALTSNRSIRILYDETGKERIVYAFVNKNLIIITTTTNALGALIERIH